MARETPISARIKKQSKYVSSMQEYLFTGKNTAGAIFNLCNNYSKSWKQTNHIDHTSKDKELSVLTSILQDIDGDTSSIGMIEEQEPLPIECDSLE